MNVNLNVSHRLVSLSYAMLLFKEGAISSDKIISVAERYYDWLARP